MIKDYFKKLFYLLGNEKRKLPSILVFFFGAFINGLDGFRPYWTLYGFNN